MSNNGVRARSAFNDSIMLRIRRADFEARLTMSANREALRASTHSPSRHDRPHSIIPDDATAIAAAVVGTERFARHA
jgi:hypothetical protein